MLSTQLLSEAFGRIQEVVHDALRAPAPRCWTFRADPQANTVAWLVWHLTRVQDDHIAELMGEEQVWNAGGWVDRFDLPFDPGATGYGQSSARRGGRARRCGAPGGVLRRGAHPDHRLPAHPDRGGFRQGRRQRRGPHR